MDPTQVLKTAWSAVEDAELPEALQPIAFTEALRLLTAPGASQAPRSAITANAGVESRRARGGRPAQAAADGDAVIDVTEDEIVNKVAEHTGVDRDRLAQLVHLDGNAVRLSLPGMRLGKTGAERTRAVAQILTIVRGFGLDEAETPLDTIRTEAMRLKCYDSANFSAHMGKLSGFVVTGSANNRKIRAKAPGIEAFPALVDRLTGEA